MATQREESAAALDAFRKFEKNGPTNEEAKDVDVKDVQRCKCNRRGESICTPCKHRADPADYACVGDRCARCGKETICAVCNLPSALVFRPADCIKREGYPVPGVDVDDDDEEGETKPTKKKNLHDDDDEDDEDEDEDEGDNMSTRWVENKPTAEKKEATVSKALKSTMQRSKQSATTAGTMLAARVPNKQLVKLALKYLPKKDFPLAHTPVGKAVLEVLIPHIVMFAAEYGQESLPNAQAIGNAANKALEAALFENGTLLQDMLVSQLTPLWVEIAKTLKPLTNDEG